MTKHNLLSVDLAKNVFQVCALNSQNKVLFNKKLSRQKFIVFMAQLPHSKVFIEACYSSHYWGRTLTEMGHSVHLRKSRACAHALRRDPESRVE